MSTEAQVTTKKSTQPIACISFRSKAERQRAFKKALLRHGPRQFSRYVRNLIASDKS
jgi:hypothetical protein